MAKIILSILIPITPDRLAKVMPLLHKIIGVGVIWVEDLPKGAFSGTINSKLYPDVNLCFICDEKVMTIGEKREQLYQMSEGLYSWQIDSDDDISDDAIPLIFQAMAASPDCITFEERCDMNGEIKRANHSLKYDKWQDNFDGFDYVRCPFYKDVIKTEIARSVPFPHIRWNEDEQWSMALRPHLKSEVHINKQLYLYSYYPTESHEERYGLNK